MKKLPITLLLVVLTSLSSFAQNTFTFALNLADPKITTYKGPCYVHLEDGFRRDELVLFLPGKGYQPTFYDQFVIQSAKLGYHGLALKYVDDAPLDIQTPCGSSAFNDCFEKAREEAITGEDVSPVVSINRINSIEHRLIESLTYLNDIFPGNGWDKFWSGDSTILWDKIRIVGHEDGAGYAAAIAKREAVARVVLMGWADWDNNTNAVPAWLTSNSATPADNWYGFAHGQDEVFPISRQEATWDSLGFASFGAVVNVDATVHPYDNSHMLTTSVTPALQNNAFNDGIIVSSYVPTNSGAPVFLDAWSYLIDGSTKVSVPDELRTLSLSGYPNPATDQLIISGVEGVITNVIATDLTGRSVALPWAASGSDIRAEVNGLSTGLYLIRVSAEEKSGTLKVLVK